MRRKIVLTLALGVGVADLVAVQPGRWPEARLRSWLLEQTPVGADETSVRRFLEGREWLDSAYLGDSGFWRDPPGGPQSVVGARSLRAHLGDYRSPAWLFLYVTSTEAFYGFDADGRLVDIWVRKTADAL